MDTTFSAPSDPTVVIDGHDVQRRRLLYIEDNQSNLTLVEWILAREADVELISAMRGRTGLEMAYEHRPDLIVLDLHLPDMPGEQVLECLQARAPTRLIPVLVLSADAGEKRIARLLRLGARDYLTKPLDIRHFLKVIADNLKTPT
jgi:DNA-binding response OmpR family regulator